MSEELIFKMCEKIISSNGITRADKECEGIICSDCPFSRINNNSKFCGTDTKENYIAIAKKYITENTEEKEMKNKFKVGDRVKKINGKPFSNGDFIVTVEEVDGCKIWFKETSSFLISEWLELAEERKIELTFKEFVNEAEEGKIYVSESGAEFYKDCGKIIIDLTTEVQRIKIPDDAILTLKKQEYTFAEAIEKAREGNVIMSLASRECYTPSEIEKSIFELSEIEGKWNVEE